MRHRLLLAISVVAIVVSSTGVAVGAADITGRPVRRDADRAAPSVPAVARMSETGRYFVLMRAPSVSDRIVAGGGTLSRSAQVDARAAALDSQRGALSELRASGGDVTFRYSTLVNGFSAAMSAGTAGALDRRADVAAVEPVDVVVRHNESSVPFIGATKVWRQLDVRGQGIRVAVVDTGIDYTHKDFGGPGTVEAYQENDPTVVERGTFPTAKVIGGYDFVGGNYDVVDDDPSNDVPRPDFDPLDRDGHGTHVAGTCCGIGVPGSVGPGVAPRAKLYAYKVWDVGNSTDDVLVAAYERAVDPDQDGDTGDRADVLQFSGGVDYGTLNSVEAVAAQRVVDLGTVFVASAGNAGNQAVGASAYITGTPASARGVISVAASIDEFLARTITVNSPAGVVLPDDGLMVVQDWGAELPPEGLTTDVVDASEFDPPATPGEVTPADQQFCSPLPANSLDGLVPIVFKGDTAAGDCSGSTKVYNAQLAGAVAVILQSGFGGVPFVLGTNGEPVTIPAVMISGPDGDAILDVLSPSPPPYNTGTVNVTLNAESSVVPGFDDAMADFSSEGPARATNELKPDISAPGSDITSAAVGTGDGASVLSGTSMAAPHVSGVAALLRQLHPSWPPLKIKAVLMNQATPRMKNNDLSEPVSATAMGAGRVQALASARATSIAYPSSLSFGLVQTPGAWSDTQSFWVENEGSAPHSYHLGAATRYSDFDPAIADTSLSTDGATFTGSVTFPLAPGERQRVWLRLTVDPSVISAAEQEFGLYYFHPNVDGAVRIIQSQNGTDQFRVPWHVAPLAASDNGVSTETLDLTDGSDTFAITRGPAAGVDHADLYLLGATDAERSSGEEDIVAVGARSFTGAKINGVASGQPNGLDPLAGITWRSFLTQADYPREPVEIGVQTAGIHSTTETLEVDVKIDAGADGVFADPDLQADYLVVKTPDAGGNVCVYDLSQTDPFAACSALYFADYTNYNGNLVGLVVDAADIGLTTAEPTFSYEVTACTGRFSGDVPAQFCDTAGGLDDDTGTYGSMLNAVDPALHISPLVCGGFWDGGACTKANPIEVSTGSAAPDDDPAILVLFPNNEPSRTPVIVSTDT
jgi:minor extracellular serine protease Vpr